MPLFFNSQKKLREGEDDLARGLFYDALRAFQSVLKRERGDLMIRGRAETGVREAKRGLMRLQLEEARRLLENGKKVDAAECCRNAIELAGGGVEAKEARELLAQIVPDEWDGSPEDGVATPAEDGPAPGDADDGAATGFDSDDIDPEDLFELHLSSLPEERAETLRGFGPEFRAAFLMSQQGRFTEALDAFARVPEDVAKHPLLRFEVAQAAHACGRHEDALKALEDIALPDELERARLEIRAVAFRALGVNDKAEAEALRLLAAAPDDESVAYLCARILTANGKNDAALDVLLPWIDPLRPRPAINQLAVTLFLRLGRTDDAVEILEREVKRYFHESLSMPHEARVSQVIMGDTAQDLSPPGGPKDPIPFPLWAGRTLLALYLERDTEHRKIAALVDTLSMYDPESEVQYRQRFEEWLDAPAAGDP